MRETGQLLLAFGAIIFIVIAFAQESKKNQKQVTSQQLEDTYKTTVTVDTLIKEGKGYWIYVSTNKGYMRTYSLTPMKKDSTYIIQTFEPHETPRSKQ